MKTLCVFFLFVFASFAQAQTAIEIGAIDQHVTLRLLDDAGAYVASQAHTDVACAYRRQGVSSAVAITEASGTLGTHADGSWAEDTTLKHYELGVPDAAFATGANWVIVGCTDANGTDFEPAVKEILLTKANPEVDVVKVTGTAVTDVDDFKADVSGLSTFDSTSDGVIVTTNNDKTGYTVSTVSDKTGYSLSGSQTFSTSGTVATCTAITNPVTAGTVSDKTGYALATDGVSAASVSTAAANKVADHVLRRSTANAEASSDGDTLGRKSLYGSVAQQTHKIRVLGGQMVTYKSDGTTELGSRDVTSDATAAPITGID